VEAEHARENAEQMGRAKIQFLARMSHELRTPLQSIAGYSELLRVGAATPLSPAQLRLLDRIRDNEQILVHVIDDLIIETQGLRDDLRVVAKAGGLTSAVSALLGGAQRRR
jgi:signal transduction histidine kinase